MHKLLAASILALVPLAGWSADDVPGRGKDDVTGRGGSEVIRVEPEVQQATAQAKGAAREGWGRAWNPRNVWLERPSAAELEAITAPRKGAEPPRIGIPRNVDIDDQFRWEATPEGGMVAAVSVTSPEASAMRIGLRVLALPRGTLLRFYKPDGEQLFEVGAEEILDTIDMNLEAGEADNKARLYWSPPVESSTVTIEIEIAPGESPADVRMSVPQISHLVASARNEFALPVAKAAAACNNDATCSAATWGDQMNAVARMVFTEGGFSYICTGTLLADADTTTTVPYFLSANHCVNTQASASTLVTYWFYRSSACNSGVVNAYQIRTGGAALLYNSANTDVSLMRLTATPPDGAVYAGWQSASTALAANTLVTGLHHPTGDLLKASFGRIGQFATCTPPSSGSFSCNYTSAAASTFYEIVWRSGATQPGSSGSGLFQDNGKYLVGQLYGGSSSCSNIAAGDVYGRFDVSYNAGMRQWLGPTAPPPPPTLATPMVSLAATPALAFIGQGVTLTAILSGSAGVPTGTVRFGDGATTIAACSAVALSSGVATCATTSFAIGVHSVNARYLGNGSYNPASSAAVSVTVTTPPPSGTNVALAINGGRASASSTWNANFPPAALINGERAGRTFGAGGTWGDSTGGVFPDWVQIDLAAPATVDRVIVYTLQDNYNTPVEPTDAMTCSVLCATGYTVQSWNGTSWVTLATVANNMLVKRDIVVPATTTSRLRVNVTGARGPYSRLAEIEVWGAPGSTTPPPPPPPATLPTPSVSLASSPNPSITGQGVTFTAVLSGSSGAPTGTVSFRDAGVAIASCASAPLAAGSATCTIATLTQGVHAITASYAGSGSYNPTVSGALSQDVQAPSTGETGNVALAAAGAVASASSTWNANFPASALINNERAGRTFGAGGTWGDGTGGQFPDWVQIDFAGPRTIDRVVVYTLQDNYTNPVEPTDAMTFSVLGVTGFNVQAWTGSAWATLATVSGNIRVKRSVTFAPFTTSRIRINTTATLGPYSRLTEIEAWGR